MLKCARKQAEELWKIEKKEIEKRQKQFKNDLEKGGGKKDHKKMKEANNFVDFISETVDIPKKDKKVEKKK